MANSFLLFLLLFWACITLACGAGNGDEDEDKGEDVFISPEDYAKFAPKESVTTDPHIERIRRCHQNDLENVLPFVLIGFMYVLTEPDMFIASLHFRLFAGARLLHTLVYLNGIQPPARGVMWFIGFCVNTSMLITVLASGNY